MNASGTTAGPLDAAREQTTRTVRTDRGTVAYAEYGDPDGVPVVFFHGTPGSRLLGALADADACEHGVRLLAPDRPGYGQSDPWADRTLAETGQFVGPVLDDAGIDRAGVLGFSGGGPHALAVAATDGDRVESVALAASAAPPDCVDDPPGVQRVLATMAARTPRLLGGLLRAQVAVARRTGPSPVVSQYTTGGTDHVPDDVAALVRDDFLEAIGSSRNGLVTESRQNGREWPVSIDRIDCQVRLWHGERDANVPVAATKRLAARLPDADLTVFDDADHLTTLLRSRSSALAALTGASDGP